MIIQAAARGWLCRRRVEVIDIIARLKKIAKEHKRKKRKEATAAAAAALGPREKRIRSAHDNTLNYKTLGTAGKNL